MSVLVVHSAAPQSLLERRLATEVAEWRVGVIRVSFRFRRGQPSSHVRAVAAFATRGVPVAAAPPSLVDGARDRADALVLKEQAVEEATLGDGKVHTLPMLAEFYTFLCFVLVVVW